MKPKTTLYRDAYLILPQHEVRLGYVITEGTIIREIGFGNVPSEKLNCDCVHNLSNCVLMPGLINAHGHTPMTLVRGRGTGLPLQRWLEEAIFPIEGKMTSADIAAGMMWGAAEMLASGTTCVADMYDFPEAGFAALAQVGLKANICRVGLSFSDDVEVPPNRLQECIDFVRNFKDPTGRIVADFCLHSEYLTKARFVQALAEANDDFKRPVHVHVSETEKEHAECMARHGKTPTAYLADLHTFEYGAYCAHGVYMTDEDFAILHDYEASIVHNPTSNMKLGSGFARIPTALKAGVNVALGTDGCASNDNLNMFEEMHLASLIHKGLSKNPTTLSAWDILDMATIAGANALKRFDTGALQVNKKADFCVVSLDAPHLTDVADIDIPAALVYSAQGSDVVMTVVDGEVLYNHGAYATINLEEARAEFCASRRRLGARK